jgi:hypothetical protein
MHTLVDTPQIGHSRSRTRPALQDPALIMRAASRRAGKWFSLLEQQHRISAGDVMAYLSSNEPDIKERLDQLWEAADTDIYGRYLEGLLDAADFRAWRRALHEWLTLLHASLALVRLRLGDQLESDFALPRESALQPSRTATAPAAA